MAFPKSDIEVIHQPRSEEPTEGRRLEGRPRARPCQGPSFETAAQARGLLRMRSVELLPTHPTALRRPARQSVIQPIRHRFGDRV